MTKKSVSAAASCFQVVFSRGVLFGIGLFVLLAILGGGQPVAAAGALDQQQAILGGVRTNIVDTDSDGVADIVDNCPLVANADQSDTDMDGIGDACDTITDSDGDFIADALDNCPLVPNPSQSDTDGDGIGNVCDPINNLDLDDDGVLNAADNCPTVPNPDQHDRDMDNIGDVCDPVNNGDADADGVCDRDVRHPACTGSDRCPGTAPGAQVDSNGCSQAQVDSDGDGVCNRDMTSSRWCVGSDLCPGTSMAQRPVDAQGCSAEQRAGRRR